MPLEEVAGKLKMVDPDSSIVKEAKLLGIVAQDSAGKRYLCVTAQAWSGWRCIFDHVALYEGYAR